MIKFPTFALVCLACPALALGANVAPIDQTTLRATTDEIAKELKVPGAVVLLRGPAGDITYTFGSAVRRENRPVTVDDHVRVGSNTKTWTGTVILQLVQEGRIQLSDPVSKFRADVPNGEQITIEQLLTMRSGLFNYSETRELNETLDREPGKAWTQAELLALAWKNKPYFPPGQGFHYSNTNTVLLGLIAEKIDGKPLAQIFQDRLFAPLHLNQTIFPEITARTLPDPSAHGYMYGDNMLTWKTPALPADMQAAAKSGALKPQDQTEANPSWGWAAGAGISTAKELALWVEALVSGRLLNPEMQKMRLESVRPMSEGDHGGALYGMAIAKFGPLYGHTGELPGYNSFMGHDPENKLTLVVWTNLAPAADGKDPATTIARTLIGRIYRSQ